MGNGIDLGPVLSEFWEGVTASRRYLHINWGRCDAYVIIQERTAGDRVICLYRVHKCKHMIARGSWGEASKTPTAIAGCTLW